MVTFSTRGEDLANTTRQHSRFCRVCDMSYSPKSTSSRPVNIEKTLNTREPILETVWKREIEIVDRPIDLVICCICICITDGGIDVLSGKRQECLAQFLQFLDCFGRSELHELERCRKILEQINVSKVEIFDGRIEQDGDLRERRQDHVERSRPPHEQPWRR